MSKKKYPKVLIVRHNKALLVFNNEDEFYSYYIPCFIFLNDALYLMS